MVVVKASLLLLLSCLVAPARAAGGGTVMIDAGSSGSKLFSFSGDAAPVSKDEKVLTECDDDGVKRGLSLKGLSTFKYEEAKCHAQVKTDLKECAAGGEMERRLAAVEAQTARDAARARELRA